MSLADARPSLSADADADALPAGTPVHVVVLAAGRGSRLGTLGDTTPKWLLPVAGRTIADRHLAGLAAAGDAVASVRVVVGHAPQPIRALLDERRTPPAVTVVENPEFDTANNWWSVLRALRELPDGGPVVVLNADLAIAAADVAAFVRAAAREEGADGLLALDVERPLTDESMKVALTGDGTVQAIGKAGVHAPAGEYIGLLMARGATLQAFRDVLESFVGHPEHADEWYEGAVGRSAAAGVAWRVWPTPSSAWVEIDDDRDLALAQDLVGGR